MMNINDKDVCAVCGAYFNSYGFCSNGHPKYIRYPLETVRSIVDLVDKDNVDNLLKDFNNWIRLHVECKELVKQNKVKSIIINKDTFTWINDGRNDINVKIELKGDVSEKTN